LLEEMKVEGVTNDSNISPDTITYGSLLYAYANFENTPHAEKRCRELVQEMEDAFDAGNDRAIPDNFTYSMLIRAIARASSAEAASEVLVHVSDRHRVDPQIAAAADTSMYNAVLGAWAFSGEGVAPQRAQSLLNQMKVNAEREESPPDRVSYKYGILAWVRSGRQTAADNARKLCEELVESGLASPDEELITKLSKFLARDDPDFEEIEALIKKL